ncbi:LCP family protein [Bacillus sp. 1P02SD]|uniref:LCP family glycopolymer transferase n=1 Tax=Bacillus sp. 1P02SD TaxID=3132264 RepID=UPI00399FF5D3
MRQEIKKKKKRRFKIIIYILLLMLLAVLGYGYYLFSSVSNTAEQMHEPLEREKSEKRVEDVSIDKKQPVSFLLMGVDEREGDVGRTDTLIITTVNPDTNKMTMFNIQRDTYTTIVGKGIKDKINHAYVYGGTEMTINTVENFLDVPIDYYIKVNMEALSDIVDAVGGITVDNPLQWIDDRYYKPGYVYQKGIIHLDGPQTLGYVRMRYQDPRGDFGRNERQRQVLSAIIDKGANITSVTKIDDILNVLGSNIKTNLTFDEMMGLQSKYSDARHNIEQFEIKSTGTTINGGSYQLVSEEERNAVSQKVKQELEIK